MSSSNDPSLIQFALSLDSFVVNGIVMGVFSAQLPFFIESRADSLRVDLLALEQALPCSGDSAFQATEIRTRCEAVINLTLELRSYRILPLKHVRDMVRSLLVNREVCLRVLHQPVVRLDTSTVSVNVFLADLEAIFTQAWHEAQSSDTVTSPDRATPDRAPLQ